MRLGVPGIGTILHLDLEHLKRLAKVDLTVVPFEGPQQIPALLGGHVDVAMAHPAPVLPHVRAGKIRVTGVFQEARNPLFPDAPTFKEPGYPVTLGVYYPLVVPKGTPKPVVQTIHDAFKKAPAAAAMQEGAGAALAEAPREALDLPDAEAQRGGGLAGGDLPSEGRLDQAGPGDFLWAHREGLPCVHGMTGSRSS